VPKHAVDSYGQFIRQALSKDPLEAEAFSKRLSDVLDGAWSATTNAPPVNISTIIESFQPRRVALSEIAAEYLALETDRPNTTSCSFEHLHILSW
jgi:hypothetical protein